MAIERIQTPTSDQPAARQVTALSGVDYILDFDWIERAGVWKMDVLTAEGAPLVTGVLLFPDVDLLQTVSKFGRPPGALAIRSKGGKVPDLNTLSDAELIYLTE